MRPSLFFNTFFILLFYTFSGKGDTRENGRVASPLSVSSNSVRQTDQRPYYSDHFLLSYTQHPLHYGPGYTSISSLYIFTHGRSSHHRPVDLIVLHKLSAIYRPFGSLTATAATALYPPCYSDPNSLLLLYTSLALSLYSLSISLRLMKTHPADELPKVL